MGDLTPNIALVLPYSVENYDVGVVNANNSKIDEEIGDLKANTLGLKGTVVQQLIGTTTNTTANAMSNIGDVLAYNNTTGRKIMALVVPRIWLFCSTNSEEIRAQVTWSGATVGDTAEDGLAGVFVSGAAGRAFCSTTRPVMLNPGTTNFRFQAYRHAGTNTTAVTYAAIAITPIAWSDNYEAGVTK